MKNIIYLFLLIFGLVNGLNAQITIGSDQIPLVGDTLTFTTSAQTTGLQVGNAGPNQVWDFSGIAIDFEQPEYYVDPASVDSSGLFPQSTIAITDQTGTNIQFGQVTSDEVIALGLISSNVMGFGAEITLNPTQTIFKYPTEYGDSFVDDYGFVFGIADPQPGVDTARVISSARDTVTADAYGVLRLPQGDFDVLRVETKSSVELTIEVFFGFFWAPILADTTYNTSYTFYARESKRELARMQLDSLGTGVDGFSWQANIDALPSLVPGAAFTHEANLSGIGQIDFTDVSTNGPVEWLWDFGDGNTADVQHPIHNYAVSDDYTVCLTATNSAGSDQVCETISVDATPPLPMAAFVYVPHATIPGLVNFTDLSTNLPNQWLWDFGNGITIMDQHPTLLFPANGNYQVCLTVTNVTGSDQVCETVTVSSYPPAPVAAFTYQDTASVPGLVHFEDLSTNDPTSWLWDFGDGVTDTNQNPTHTFTSDNTFNVCLTVTNAGGSHMVCESLFVNVANVDLSWNPDWIIAPNPSTGKFTISFNNTDVNDMKLFVYDSTGKLIENLTMAHTVNLDLSSMGSGAYLIQLTQDQQTVANTWVQVMK